MVSTDTWITAVCVVLAVVLWYGTRLTIDSRTAAIAVLIGVGLVVPLGINGLRARTA
ncbi:hypothetical protein [Halalkalicoccus sp. NIPERK01]|uniref:hypothetical protein n=1 Tax=Halalkalicoccus sp. NIPERK01 TaxID=3053469 RepID=UPI00256F1FE8|nr:hypothetical protein [Halalkalicoccus sp. NIPERK01]MDL5361607.1 hypothetical protein [Halalkalicoccus sp. NIPERK01]